MLDQMISPHRKLYSMHDALRWSCQIAEGLEYLHSGDRRALAPGATISAVLALLLPACWPKPPPWDVCAVNPMVIHRDLKAENILLMSSPDNPKRFDAKLCDFGLHKLVRGPRCSCHLPASLIAGWAAACAGSA